MSIRGASTLSLLRPFEETDRWLEQQITQGEALRDRKVASEKATPFLTEVQAWRDFSRQLLSSSFSGPDFLVEYDSVVKKIDPDSYFLVDSWREAYSKQLRREVDQLRNIRGRLKLVVPSSSRSGAHLAGAVRPRVFVVHGHDHAAKVNVGFRLEKLGCESVILHERPNAGRTIIEKLQVASDVAFAVVLLTPDDEVRHAGAIERRARQNVVFELGYFIGLLGRERVCALYADGVALPSDFAGVTYVKYDASGKWETELERELRAAGVLSPHLKT